MGRQDAKIGGSYRYLKGFSIQDMVVLIVAAVFFTLEIYTFALTRSTINDQLPENYGNSRRIIDSLKASPPRDSFSFGVVGDTVSSATFHQICRKFEERPLSFIVMVGDFADKCRKPYHDFFKYECLHSYRLSVPVFLVAGNRDVDYDNTYNNDISLESFDAMYGTGNFSFEYADCLFIGVCIFPTPVTSTEGIQFLETTLAEKRKENQRVFVFTHIPPLLEAGTSAMSKENSRRFIEVAAKHKVDYVIAGHLHGYARYANEYTVYLTTGGGGATLKETKSFNGLHHAMAMTVDPVSVQEEVILVEESKYNSSKLPRIAIAKLYPLMSNHPLASTGVNVLVILVMLLSVVNFISRLRQKAQ